MIFQAYFLYNNPLNKVLENSKFKKQKCLNNNKVTKIDFTKK